MNRALHFSLFSPSPGVVRRKATTRRCGRDPSGNIVSTESLLIRALPCPSLPFVASDGAWFRDAGYETRSHCIFSTNTIRPLLRRPAPSCHGSSQIAPGHEPNIDKDFARRKWQFTVNPNLRCAPFPEVSDIDACSFRVKGGSLMTQKNDLRPPARKTNLATVSRSPSCSAWLRLMAIK